VYTCSVLLGPSSGPYSRECSWPS